MSVSRLPNGRWRGQVYTSGKTVSAAKVLGLPADQATFSSKRKAQDAVAAARRVLSQRTTSGVTVREWAHTWTTDPYWARPKLSTDIQNRRRIRPFVDKYGDLPLERVGDREVAELVRGSRGRLASVRAMFHDAMRMEAGRLLDRDPFLGIKAEDQELEEADPPSEEMVRRLIEVAGKLVNPGFAGWLQVAAYSGLRPGELDALRWSNVDFDGERIRVVEQFNNTSKAFSLPKNGLKRKGILTDQAREALEPLDRRSEFCFTNLRGNHWRETARYGWWDKVRAEAGYDGTLYLATRHFAGSFMTNVLKLPADVVAIQLGHTDGGQLVQKVYRHLDKERVLDEVLAAYRSVGNVVALRPVGEQTAHEPHTEGANVAE